MHKLYIKHRSLLKWNPYKATQILFNLCISSEELPTFRNTGGLETRSALSQKPFVKGLIVHVPVWVFVSKETEWLYLFCWPKPELYKRTTANTWWLRLQISKTTTTSMGNSHQIFLAFAGTELWFVREYLQQGHFQRDVSHFHGSSDEFSHIWGILIQF